MNCLTPRSCIRSITLSGSIWVALVQPETEARAFRLLRQYADQDFSYVDATSFVAMRHLSIREAFTFDHHFLVAGFSLVSNGA